MSFKTWWKKHFTLGIILSGALGSLVCSIFWEYVRPNTIPFLRPVLSAVWRGLAALRAWIAGTVPVPRWWYGLLLLYTVGTLLALVLQWVREKLAPTWREYTQDVFKGMRWRWRLNRYDGAVENLAPFCLRCDRQLIPGEGSFNREGFHEIRHTFDCRQHGHQFDLRGDVREVLAEVEEEIQLKLRNGAWEEAVRRNQTTPPSLG